MVSRKSGRRLFSTLLLVLGGFFMLFAPETWHGIVLLLLGISIELLAIVLSHRRPR